MKPSKYSDDLYKLSKQLHNWYLEATKELSPECYNKNAQKKYDDLTDEQQLIDRYIAKKIKEEFSNKLEQFKKYFNDWYFSFQFSALDNILTDTQLEHIKKLKKKIEELK